MAKSSETALVVSEQSNGLAPVIALDNPLAPSAKRFWSSLDLKSPGGQRDYLKAKQGECLPVDGFIGKPIEIVDLLFHEAESLDPETGEMSSWIRGVLITKAREFIGVGSTGIKNSLADIITVRGNPPFDPPLRVMVKQRTTAAKRRMYYLEIV